MPPDSTSGSRSDAPPHQPTSHVATGSPVTAADGLVDRLDADDRWWAAYDDWVPEG